MMTRHNVMGQKKRKSMAVREGKIIRLTKTITVHVCTVIELILCE